MELNIVKHIKEHGLDETVNKFNLKSKDYGHKIVIKYDMIDSDLSQIEVQEARGLILEKDTWKVMSMSFMKFFNSGESHAARIDWDNAHILEKLDGTMIQVYWDWVKKDWCVGTTGTAEGEGEVNNKFGTNFADLFWNTVPDKTIDNLLNGYTYKFELCTPYNIVVKPHETSSVHLLGIRDLETLREIAYPHLNPIAGVLGVPRVKSFNLNAKNSGHLIKTFEGMPFSEEGYVVVDGNFNRIKIKNPAYVAAHHLKSKTSEHAIMDIIKTNEIEEFSATFPERKEEIEALKKAYDILTLELEAAWAILKEHRPKNITKSEQKKYAMKVFEVAKKHDLENFTGLFFSLKDYKVLSIQEFLQSYDNKKLYNYLDVTEKE